ncbi:Serine/Threonine protein kinase with WD40 repeats [Lyngbya sp. PCC 8106]|nr:Serine/Threonine protein kinase with WD40 repeats [Lyngbya sp. PCC 8106]
MLQGRYHVTKQLGGGGFGKTFEITDDHTGINKVVKVLLKEHPKAVQLFKQEAKVLSKLQHPGTPKVDKDGYFTFMPKGGKEPIHCLVMEKIEGANLQDWMKSRKKEPISQEQAIEWLKQLAEILDKVHSLNYFHRDIKPQNIMRKPDGQLVLIDFGTAREETDTFIAKMEGGQNVTGIISPGYTPPEQANGKAVPQSDFFALGRTFVYLLTGKPPTAYPENPRTGKLLWRKGAPNISTQLSDLLDYLMATFPGNRPQTPQVILKCLREIDLTQPVSPKVTPDPPPKPPSKRKPRSREVIPFYRLPRPSIQFNFPFKFLWIMGTFFLMGGLFYTQINGYLRYGFIPANPILILKSIPSSLWLQGYKSAVGQVYTVAISPDGQTLVAGSFGNITIWDLQTGKLLYSIAAHSSWVKALAISPDGEILASGSNDKTIRLWDLKQGIRRRTIEGHTESVNTLAFSPDGQTLASGSDDRTIRLWDLKTGARILTIPAHDGPVNSIAFSPDGQTLASGSSDQTIKLWGLTQGTRKLTISGHSGAINDIAYTTDGQSLGSVSDDGTIRLWNPNTGDQVRLFSAQGSDVKSMVISPDGQTLFSGSDRIIIWDLKTGEQKATLWGHAQTVNALALSPNGEILVSGSEDKTIKIWQVPVNN